MIDKTKGVFVRFRLDFEQDKVEVPADGQALQILDRMNAPSFRSHPGCLITYSANENQTEAIAQTYAKGGWQTGTNGMNQAEVMAAMETLLGTPGWAHLQQRARIAPLTTIPTTSKDESAWKARIRQDLDLIENQLKDGWVVLGWINQKSDPEFAVGGGVAGALPAEMHRLIQDRLSAMAKDYPELS